MSYFTLQSHLYAHNLPLRWLRLPLLLATLGLTAVCIAVGVQAIRGTIHLEAALKRQASQESIEVDFDMQDVRSVTIVLTTVALLLGITSLTCIIMLCLDWSSALVRSHSNNGTKDALKLPRSTSTLRIQAITLSFLTLWLFTVLIPTTIFVRHRSAKVTSNASATFNLGTFADPVYWDYGFLRCLGAAPWFSFMVAFPLVLVTICAAFVARRINHGRGEDEVAEVNEKRTS